MYPKQQRRPLPFLVYLSFFGNADPPRAHPPTQLYIVHWGLTERKQLHSGPASVVKVEQVRRVGGKCLNYTVSSLNVKYAINMFHEFCRYPGRSVCQRTIWDSCNPMPHIFITQWSDKKKQVLLLLWITERLIFYLSVQYVFKLLSVYCICF